ncbi:hypothetical protein HYH03_010968 [Edaphochlamys debaryana]|uniref:FAD-binding domain-containing protein n=1 Tax=Edaphochlamys debaryana TaxID=47281 RepID=A0A835XVJ4_9CHLO|nr:hypothetical protein HYH03_010968 [Edaphochlamys debaryana]|eukprot:KAG2490574.1 hypothetical protein HYH03_010968 [Edaphochlamys debaryana]
MYEQGIYKMRFSLYDERTGELKESLPTGAVHYGTKLADVRELSPEEQAAAGGFRYALSLERTAEAGAEATAGSGAAGGERLEVRARWLVGADGYFSRVRRQVGDGKEPVASGAIGWWANVTPEDLAAAGAEWPAALRDMGALQSAAVAYLPAGYPGTSGPRAALMLRGCLPVFGREGGGTQELGIWYMQARPEDLEAAGLDSTTPAAAPGQESPALARALATFSFLPDDVRAFLAATKPEQVTERSLPMHPWEGFLPGGWANGRGMVLVGDAAHAPRRPDGQGANTAFEDAAVLAACVKEHGMGDEAFAAFEKAQQERVAAVYGSAQLSYAERVALIHSVSFEPLWSPTDLPVPVASMEEGLAWSYETIRGIVQRRSGLELGARAERGGELVQKAEASKPAVVAA